MSQVKVKICGLTRIEDVRVAIRYGADAVGFVFATSPRQVSAGHARDLTAAVPDGIIRVGLFMDQSPEFVTSTLDQVRLDLLQFHGNEDNAYCRFFDMPFIKAVAMGEGEPALSEAAFPDAQGLLLDSHQPGAGGGTGQRFDWNKAALDVQKPIWVAGGLNPENVASAVRFFRPYAVDVSSGVEDKPGIKNETKIQQFIARARQD